MENNLLLMEVPQGEAGLNFIKQMRIGYLLGNSAENKQGFNYVLEDLMLEIGHPLFTRTTDYSIFKMVKSNRKIVEKNVINLMKKIQEKNLLYIKPILLNEFMEVIDGQHRLEAAKRMNLPIYYLIVHGLTRKDMAMLNSTKRVWSFMDYVHHYAIEGNKNFLDFNRLCRKYSSTLKPSWVQALCARDGRRCTEDVKDGIMDITNIAHVEKWIVYMEDMTKYIDKNIMYSSRFIEAVVPMFDDNYDHEKMMKNLRKRGDTMTISNTKQKYTTMLQSLYN
jgi:hypothetical protein